MYVTYPMESDHPIYLFRLYFPSRYVTTRESKTSRMTFLKLNEISPLKLYKKRGTLQGPVSRQMFYLKTHHKKKTTMEFYEKKEEKNFTLSFLSFYYMLDTVFS